MNHCPVYFFRRRPRLRLESIRPHGVGPTPALCTGLKNALDLPHASTGCNQCGAVCPVGIPLSRLLARPA